MAGQRDQHERGHKATGRAQPGNDNTETGADTPANRRRATNAPTGATAGPRATNLIPRVRTTEEHPSTSQPRATAAPRFTGAPRLIGDTGETATIPRQSNGRLKTASAPPEAPHAPTKMTGKTTGKNTGKNTGKTGTPTAGASSPRIRKTLPPETIILPALPDSTDPDGDADSSDSQVRRRRRSTARPVRPEDTELVARQTLILNALEIVGEDAREATAQVPALRNPTDMVIVDADPQPRTPVTVVPAGALAPTPVWLQPRRKGQRSLVAGFVTCLITLGLVLGVLVEASPLTRAQGGLPLGLLGVQNASNTATGDPTGPWDTQSGAYLGLGGGAGPGVKAPGSAGLPTGKSSSDSSPKTNSTPTTPSYISKPPVYPWPPTWAYMYVPGHPSFKMNPLANGYYWWAFGQCTWWAQYKRQDENLRHMGNARYWAAGAASRGYRVGRTPVPNATVVFQPGIQGAGGAGHVAHVEKVYPYGWFLISEMNFYWNGGGWGRVSYRFAHAGYGVSFIY